MDKLKTNQIHQPSYFNHDSGIFYDERKKRFEDFKEISRNSYEDYTFQFRNYRPDFFGRRSIDFDYQLLPMANLFLFRLYQQRQFELGRLYLLFGRAANNYSLPLYQHHINHGEIDKITPHRHIYWDDASRNVNYFDYAMRRIKRYGLQFGALTPRKFPNYKDKIQEEEDRLTEYFVYEMRKEPMKGKEIPLMPLR